MDKDTHMKVMVNIDDTVTIKVIPTKYKAMK